MAQNAVFRFRVRCLKPLSHPSNHLSIRHLPRTQRKCERESPTTTRRLSKDGVWRSFAKVPNLIQYVPNGNYYARIKLHGKVIRRSLETHTFTTAKLKLRDFLRERTEMATTSTQAVTFGEALALYEQRLKDDAAIKPASKEYRQLCIGKLKATWPGVLARRVHAITSDECRQWAAQLRLSSHYFNNTVGTLRQIFDVAIREHKVRGVETFENPASDIPRVRVKQKQLTLPEPDQFKALVEEIRRGSGGRGPRIAELVEFLAYSGLRAFSEAAWVTWNDVDWNRREIIVRGDPSSGTKNSEVRRLPILQDMERLLHSVEARNRHRRETDCILTTKECRGALARACQRIGILVIGASSPRFSSDYPGKLFVNGQYVDADLLFREGISIPEPSTSLLVAAAAAVALLLQLERYWKRTAKNE